VNTNKEIFS